VIAVAHTETETSGDSSQTGSAPQSVEASY
jgi:hypothetical protein